jgi:superfamily II DNA or RNA helicase
MATGRGTRLKRAAQPPAGAPTLEAADRRGAPASPGPAGPAGGTVAAVARGRTLAVSAELGAWLADIGHDVAPAPASRLRFAVRPDEAALEMFESSAEGGWSRIRLDPADLLQESAASYAATDLTSLRTLVGLRRTADGAVELTAAAGARALQQLAEAGCLTSAAPDGPALRWSEPRDGALAWRGGERRGWRVTIDAGEGVGVLATEPTCFVDVAAGAVGVLQVAAPAALVSRLLDGPALTLEQLSAFAPQVARRLAPYHVAIDTPHLLSIAELGPTRPVPRLVCRPARSLVAAAATAGVGRAELSFAYGPVTISGAPAEPVVFGVDGERLWRIDRIEADEEAALGRLAQAGFVADRDHRLAWPQPAAAHAWQLTAPDSAWPQLLADLLPALQRDGWEVIVTPDFPFELIEPAAWRASVAEQPAGGGGLAGQSAGGGPLVELAFEAEIEGRRIPASTLLAALLQRLGRGRLEAALAQPQGHLVLPWAVVAGPEPEVRRRGRTSQRPSRGRWLSLPAAALAPLLPALDGERAAAGGAAPQVARLARFDLDVLVALDRAGYEMRSIAGWLAAARALSGLEAVPQARPSPRLRARLRPYQLDGLSWLSFLRDHGLNGILADDMGLGKTLQTLALLIGELDAGRLDRPALIVVPTSVLHGWREQAARFTPELKLYVSHGAERHLQFGPGSGIDVVLTSYALLVRDVETLARTPWHYLVLDESHHVKNVRSRAAKVLAGLTTRHRLFLSGTPLENHLGELWSQFNLLMPGLLGDARAFLREFRLPIERDRDPRRAELLRARVRPFILRRTKEEVAKELPAKSEIVVRVDIEGAQRALYDSLHATLAQRVRAALDRGDPNQQRVIALSALLKLRQVCSDPALLRNSGPVSAPSAKRKLLMEWLPELVEEGRRVLVFSSFATMLDLLADDLRRAGIGFSKLTGRTHVGSRAAQIDAFQSRERPVFLVSLKAGGVGLDLTAADTVVLYDPWWNPAAEQQAADRAHRIGQDRPVFVYRLIAADTVEERIAELQRRKSALAGQVLDGHVAESALSAEELQGLFVAVGAGPGAQSPPAPSPA